MATHNEGHENEPLGAIRDARAVAADRLRVPRWWHPLIGGAAGGFTVVFALSGWQVRILAMVLFVAGAIALVTWWQRRSGVAVAARSGGRADNWTGVAAFTALAGVIAASAVARFTERVWLVVLIGLLVAVVVAAVSPRVGRELRDEVRGGPASA